MTENTFTHLAASDRVDHEHKIVYTSPRPGAPPVCTAYWTPEDWAKWDTMTDRTRSLMREAQAAGYRVVAI